MKIWFLFTLPHITNLTYSSCIVLSLEFIEWSTLLIYIIYTHTVKLLLLWLGNCSSLIMTLGVRYSFERALSLLIQFKLYWSTKLIFALLLSMKQMHFLSVEKLSLCPTLFFYAHGFCLVRIGVLWVSVSFF